MIRALLVRGMLAGFAGGVVAAVFAWIVGEPQIRAAIAFEKGHEASGGHEHVTAAGGHLHDTAEVVVSRGVQETFGLSVALGLFGIAIGGVFALVFAGFYGRLGALTARPTAALLAGAGFVIVGLAPFLKYPANPPAVGKEDTVGDRTVLYLALIAISVVAAVVAAQVGHRLAVRLGGWNATVAGGAVFVGLLGVAYAALPAVNEVPVGFPAAVLWRFRLASLGTLAVTWAVLGLVFGALAPRCLNEEQPVQSAKAPTVTGS
ncbi:CbtA family protein [Actinomadura sp. WMMA1423]|uniref:CbtA family protein n=1 Tax=Actinomadura sp. WMMA1423 TaxID=2591108 RepID=UPI001146FCAA|nr:CbtA family protein [Actinomadura sp. WMMA1423]